MEEKMIYKMDIVNETKKLLHIIGDRAINGASDDVKQGYKLGIENTISCLKTAMSDIVAINVEGMDMPEEIDLFGIKEEMKNLANIED